MPQFEYSNLPFGAVGLTGIAAPRHYCGTTAPTAGTYNVGDVCENPSPTASGSETALLTTGWICTTAGSPGTWSPIYSQAADQALTYTATTGTLTQGYRDIILNAATGPTLSLPAASARLAASQLTIKNIAANSATLSPLAANAIIDASAITLTQNETVNLFTNGTTNWYVANTPVQPVVTTTFVASNTLAGYPSLTLLNGASGATVNLPVPTLAGTGTRMTIKNLNAGAATLTPITPGNYADAAAITLAQYAVITLQASGTFWYKVA